MVHSSCPRSWKRFYVTMVLNIERLHHSGRKPMARSSVRIVLCSSVCRSHIWRRRSCVLNWLTAYRSTPQVTTGATPFPLMFGREMQCKLPELRRETGRFTRRNARQRLVEQVERRGAVPKSIRVSDAVQKNRTSCEAIFIQVHSRSFRRQGEKLQ